MKVLVVDDDHIIVDVIKNSVNWKRIGIEDIKIAYDVESAKTILKEENVDIIISDIEMPKESGLDLLKWYRNEGYSGKFLLLTCHEKFSYATKAIELQAADYLLKPFNVEVMELVLEKNLKLLDKERKLEQRAVYGQWIMENMEEVRLAFFESLINGKIRNDPETVEENIRIRNLDINPQSCYRLIVSNVTNTENDYEQYGRESVQFMLTNLHSEIICHMKKGGRVIFYDKKDSCILITICDEEEERVLYEHCRNLVERCGEILDSTVTLCVSNLCRLEEFKTTAQRILEIQRKNIIFYGQAFFESEATAGSEEELSVLDMEIMERFLNQHEQKKLLDYLKKEMEVKIQLKVMDERMIKIIRFEFQQAVFTYLARQGIQISRLLQNPTAMRIAEKAERSSIDLIRWANYLIGKVFEAEEEVKKSQTLIEKVNIYIQEHYKENIGRNEIGAKFFVVPEYLAKVYKKKTGKTLKDYINEYRVEQAKILLRNPQMRVIDVAMETGFDNVSYFSTLFKKITGITPNDYRKQ